MNATSRDGAERVLLIQCCHPTQLIFLARKLARLHPDWRLELLASDRPEIRKTLEGAVEFERIHWLSSDFRPEALSFDRVVYPLLNRGFWRIKRRARAIGGTAWESDYEGSLRPLETGRLWASAIRAPHRATAEFAVFHKNFAPDRLGPEILLLHSCLPSLLESTRKTWRRWLPEDPRITRVAGRLVWREFSLLRRRKFDSALVFFSGQRGHLGLKLLPFLLRVPQVLVVNERGACFVARPASLASFAWQRFWHGVSPPRSRLRILLVQTETPRYLAHAARRLKEDGLYPEAEVVLLCRQADLRSFAGVPEIDRVVAYRGGSWREKWRLLRKLRDLHPDLAGAVFSGRGLFRPAKLLFFLFADRPLLAFNAGLDCYWVTARSWPRLLRKDTPLYLEASVQGTPVTLVQTEAWQYTLEALRRLRSPALYPSARVTLYCSGRDRARFEGEPGVERIETFEEAAKRGWLRVWLEERRRRPDLAAAVFSGRGVFRKPKLLFLLLPRGGRLIFNARMDAYWLGWKTLARPFRREPLLFGLDAETSSEALLIQTESESATRDALRTMLSGKVVPQKRAAVFCHEELAARFATLPEVSRVYTYRPGAWRGNWATLVRMARADRDVAAAILSGRSVFRFQKLLFLTLPTRNRLVFNENLDCFYLPRSRVARMLHLPSFAPRMRRQSVLSQALRLIAKGALFLPRFAYLLLWLTYAKMKRVRRLTEEGEVLRRGITHPRG